MADSDKSFMEQWEKGHRAGRFVGGLVPDGTEAHESHGDVYCTAFYRGMMESRAWRNGVMAARELKPSCYYLADKEDPDLAADWIGGMALAFEEDETPGFEA